MHSEAFEFWLQGDVGYFYPTNHKFREIYHEGVIYGGEIDVPLSECFAVWVNADYFSKSGHSIGLHDHTRISLVPVGFGIKYFVPLKCLSRYLEKTHFYVGAGLCYVYLKVHNDSDYVKKHIHKDGLGWMAKSGIMVDLPHNFFLDVFSNYIDKEFAIHTHRQHVKADVSNVNVGIGIGYKFGQGIPNTDD